MDLRLFRTENVSNFAAIDFVYSLRTVNSQYSSPEIIRLIATFYIRLTCDLSRQNQFMMLQLIENSIYRELMPTYNLVETGDELFREFTL